MLRKKKVVCFVDSGVGGLTIVKKARAKFDDSRIFYYRDIKNMPYGNKTKEELFKKTLAVVENCVRKGATTIVIACSTQSVNFVELYRQRYRDVEFIPTELPIMTAVKEKKKNILVVSTKLSKPAIEKKFEHLGNIKYLALPNLASIVEDYYSRVLKLGGGFLKASELSNALSYEAEKTFGYYSFLNVAKGDILEEVRKEFGYYHSAQNFDAVVLACTHYEFVLDTFKEIFKSAKIYLPDINIC
ncbi:MAG: hypothetical protein FWE79_00605 [Firmicutes bacterium]|nr:hypothetical protein [Bacillota bacterium]